MNDHRLSHRMLRRSGHRSRSVAVSIVLVVLALLTVYAGIECVLAALGVGPLLVAPADALAFRSPYLAFVALIGVALVAIAVVPARQARHELVDERMAVVVDDLVLAGAIKSSAARVARVPANRLTVSVARRLALVRVVPTSGSPLAGSALESAAVDVLDSLEPRPAVRVKARVAEHGVVGS